MSEKVKRGISLALTAVAYGALSLEAFGVFDIGGVWSLAVGTVGFAAGYFGIEFVEPVRED
jgi:hypothetical protein